MNKKLKGNKKIILLTGSTGMVGKSLIKKLNYKIFSPNKKQLNLFNFTKVKNYIKKKQN